MCWSLGVTLLHCLNCRYYGHITTHIGDQGNDSRESTHWVKVIGLVSEALESEPKSMLFSRLP